MSEVSLSPPADALPAMALQVRRQYDQGNAAQEAAGYFGMAPECVTAYRAMQDAYVDYVAAYGRAYPAEAHLLPVYSKGQVLPEYAIYIAAAAVSEAADRRRFDVKFGVAL
jgi:hypothetical protein